MDKKLINVNLFTAERGVYAYNNDICRKTYNKWPEFHYQCYYKDYAQIDHNLQAFILTAGHKFVYKQWFFDMAMFIGKNNLVNKPFEEILVLWNFTYQTQEDFIPDGFQGK